MKCLKRFTPILCGLFVLCGCTQTYGGESSSSPTIAATPDVQQMTSDYDAFDRNTSADGAVEIALNGDSITAGEGVSVTGSVATIQRTGTYRITGSLLDGQIVVDAPDAKVHLVLDGASITCQTSAPLFIADADRVTLTLAEGSQNTLTDGESYVFADGEDEPNATLFSKDDLTINGTGALTIQANYNNGIGGKDDLYILSGTISVTAQNNGIKGKDSLVISGGNLSVTAGGNGLKSSNTEDASRGYILIEGGDITVSAGEDGVEAETYVTVSAGNLTITTGGGSANASTNNDDWGNWGGGMPGGRPNAKPDGSGMPSLPQQDGTDNPDDMGDMLNGQPAIQPETGESLSDAQQTDADTESSAKALKADTGILISGGTIVVDSSDDSVHSNGFVTISGGQLTLSSGDDGIHADQTVTITDGNIVITQSYEGIEGANVIVDGGTIDLTASDDGLNVAGGSDGSSINGRPGQNAFAQAGDYHITINGGTVRINASGDGIDSNGDLTINGGVVLVNGPTSNADGSIDSESGIYVNGGILVAVGSAGMAETPSNASKQNVVDITFSSSQSGLLSLVDADGNVLLAFEAAKAYQSAIISAPGLTTDVTYSVQTGGTATGDDVLGFYENAAVTGGSEALTFTVSDVITKAGTGGGSMMPGGQDRPNGGFDFSPR